MNSVFHIAIVVSHPIQHFCPQYQSFSKLPQCRVKVFFASAIGYKKYTDKNFGKEISWNNLGLENFDHVFLNGEAMPEPDKNLDAPSLDQELERFGPHLLITYGYYQKLSRRAQAWGHSHKVATAYISDSEQRSHRSIVKEWTKHFLVKKRLAHIDYFLTVGDANEAYLRYYGASDRKFIRMPFSIDTTVFEPAYQDKAAIATRQKAAYDLPPQEDLLVLGVVGKLLDFKRQGDIIAALQLLDKQQDMPPMVLLVIGTGPEEERLRTQSAGLKKHRVIFTGFIMPENLPALYAALDIYIHPAEKEPHSLAISEAIYMGCPVILSNHCGSYGSSDDVQQGKNGFVYDTGNIRQLASLVQYLAQQPGLRQRLGAYGRSFAVHAQQQSHGAALLGLIEIMKANQKAI